MEYRVCRASELAEGGRRVVRCGEAEIGVFRVNGELRAWHNSCPHRQGPVCIGRINPKVTEPLAEDRTTRSLAFDTTTLHLACPWHGYEFDLSTGLNAGGWPGRLRPAALRVEDDEIYVRP